MRIVSISIRIRKLRIYYNWYSFLHYITKSRYYFDKKIKIGIMILALMSLLSACDKNIVTGRLLNNESLISSINDTTFLNKIEKSIKSQPADSSNKILDLEIVDCYLVVDVSCYDTAVIPEENETDTNKIYQFVEEPPKFPDGEDEFMKFITSNFKFPNNGVDAYGKVYIQFVVNKQGKVENAKILRGLEPDIDTEALRVVGSSPDWIPGKHNGKVVNVAVTIPIVIKLDE